jgi:chromosome segregation ATPase
MTTTDKEEGEEEKEDINQLIAEGRKWAKILTESKKEARTEIEQLRLHAKHHPQHRKEIEKSIEELETEINRPVEEEGGGEIRND